MGKFFKLINKTGSRPQTKYIRAPYGSQILFCEVDEIVGLLPNPSNEIPHCLEADGWGEEAVEGDTYYADEFEIECISEEEYNENI